MTVPLLGCYLWFWGHEWVPRPSKPSGPLTMAEAREVNAAIPFVDGPVEPARRYWFKGSPAAKLQATDCLATAALYEAGADARGQKAVMQVVINRLRHPGYPGTVCGVVYQGSFRKTGCQFSFTCDGSRDRRRIRDGWEAARHLARRVLDGEASHGHVLPQRIARQGRASRHPHLLSPPERVRVRLRQGLVVPERLELPTPTLGMWRSILLSDGTTLSL